MKIGSLLALAMAAIPAASRGGGSTSRFTGGQEKKNREEISVSGLPETEMGCNGLKSLCDQPYSRVTFVGANQSPLYGESGKKKRRPYQHLSVTDQLHHGVRAVTATLGVVNLNKGNTKNKVFLACHPGEGCRKEDRQTTLTDWLTDIRLWAHRHPNEVVTVIIDNPAENIEPDRLDPAIEQAGLHRYLFQTNWPLELDEWPTLGEMIEAGTNVVLFAERPQGYSSEYLRLPPYILDKDDHFFANSPFQHDILFNVTEAVVPDPRYYEPKVAPNLMGIAHHTLMRTDATEKSQVRQADFEPVLFTNLASTIMMHVAAWREHYLSPPNIVLLNFVDLSDPARLSRIINDGSHWPVDATIGGVESTDIDYDFDYDFDDDDDDDDDDDEPSSEADFGDLTFQDMIDAMNKEHEDEAEVEEEDTAK